MAWLGKALKMNSVSKWVVKVFQQIKFCPMSALMFLRISEYRFDLVSGSCLETCLTLGPVRSMIFDDTTSTGGGGMARFSLLKVGKRGVFVIIGRSKLNFLARLDLLLLELFLI